jgi:thiamine biosynthesis lipoprotein
LDKNDYLEVVELNGMSLVTSGSYERYYTVGGKNYSHIIDPDTLFPPEYFSSVTIIAKDSGIADVLSTAVFNMPYEQGTELIESIDGVEALWAFGNGKKRYSNGFANYIQVR